MCNRGAQEVHVGRSTSNLLFSSSVIIIGLNEDFMKSHTLLAQGSSSYFAQIKISW